MIRRALYLAHMLHNSRLPPAVLAQRQSRQLAALVRHASARVPFYRELYAARAPRAAEFTGTAELPTLPIISKALLRAAGSAALALDAPRERVTIRTSGSSGQPFQFEIDRDYDQWRKAQYLRPYVSNGRRLTDIVLRLAGRPAARAPWFSRLGVLREWRLACDADPAVVVETWHRSGARVLQGYPSALRLLAHHCLEHGPLTPAPRRVFTDSELLLPDTRALLTQAFGIPPIDVYGSFESDNIAFECAAHDGYHVAVDCVVVEIVRDGAPVAVGEEGEVVVTVLRNRTLPFIRYNLGDIGRLSARRCSCGRSLPLLEGVRGRFNDDIILADGSRRPTLGIFARMNAFVDGMREYQLRQLGFTEFELYVVPSAQFSDAHRQGILAAAQAGLGDARLTLRLVAHVASGPSGKRRVFIPLEAQHA